MKKLIIALLIVFGFSACTFSPQGETMPVVDNTTVKEITNPDIEWDNFDVHLVYLSLYYSSMVYGADGSWFMADDWVYVKDPLLMRMRPDGTEKEILPDNVNQFGLYDAVYHDGWIYFIGERYMYLDTLPPPGTNEHLLRMRPDGSNLQGCANDVSVFTIHKDWIVYQSGYSLYTVKIGKWDNPYALYQSSEETQATWLLRNWIVSDNYIFYSINESRGGDGQYNTKMYRMDLNGANKILLMENTSIVYDPRFIYDGYLYFSSYQSGIGDIIYRMNIDGTNIITIIKPDHYVLLRSLLFRDDWLYYEYSWRDSSKIYSESLNESIRKVRPDGTDDREANWSLFGGVNENVQVWLEGNFVLWQTTSWVTSGKVTRQRLYIAPANRTEDAVEIFDGGGWESPMGYYIWNGNIYIFVKSWR